METVWAECRVVETASSCPHPQGLPVISPSTPQSPSEPANPGFFLFPALAIPSSYADP